MLNQFFQHIFAINLPRCPERRAHCERIFKLCGWQVEFVEGFDSGNYPDDGQGMHDGAYGACISHMKVIGMAIERGLDNYLVFEDDILVDKQIEKLLPEYLPHVPTDWDFLYLGWLPWCGHDHFPGRFADRVWGMNGAHAIGVRNTVYHRWLAKMATLTHHCDTAAAMLAGRMLHPQDGDAKAYCLTRNLITQGGFGSLFWPDNPDIPGPEVLEKYL